MGISTMTFDELVLLKKHQYDQFDMTIWTGKVWKHWC